MNLNWTKDKQTEQKVGYKTVIAKFFTMPNGKQEEFTTWGKTGVVNVAIIALTQDNRVIVARQYRPGPEKIMDELPGGGIEAGETPKVAALRELEEETGYTTNDVPEYIGSACRDAYTNETNHYFMVKNCQLTHPQKLDKTEFIEVALISPQKLIANAKSAMLTDAIAVFMAYDKLIGNE